LTVVRPEVELEVIAGNIPESLTLDISEADIGDPLTISMIEMPEGAKPTIDRDFVIGNISAPSSLRSADDEDADEGEAETEAEEATEDSTEE